MTNKKAIVITVLVAIIVAIIAGMFMMMIFGNVAEASGAGTMVDSMCRFNAGLVSSFSETGRGLLPLIFCPQRTVTIDATDWSKCNAELYKKDLANGKNFCAAQQILQLADRCWYMYGDGKLSISGDVIRKSEVCFKFKVVNLPKTGTFSIDDGILRRVAGENTNLRLSQTYCSEFSCADDGERGAPMQRIAWPETYNAEKNVFSTIKVKANEYWIVRYTDSAKTLGVFNLVGAVENALSNKKEPFLFIGTA